MLGIRNFNQEILVDIMKNPFGYITSLGAGLITATKVVTTSTDFDGHSEILKSLIVIATAVVTAILVFITNKIISPIWEQKLKEKVYKFLKLK
jgi:hypothetical protein